MSWTPDGNYIAITGSIVNNTQGSNLQIWKFDGLSTTFVTSLSITGSAGKFTKGSWSPDGKLFAVGSDITGTTSANNTTLFVYYFDGNNFIQTASYQHDASILCTAWSSNGKYIAMGSEKGLSSVSLATFKYDSSGLTHLSDFDFTIYERVNDVSWNNDDTYLAAFCKTPFPLWFETNSPPFPQDINFHRVSYDYTTPSLSLQNARIKLKQDTTLSSINLRLG